MITEKDFINVAEINTGLKLSSQRNLPFNGNSGNSWSEYVFSDDKKNNEVILRYCYTNGHLFCHLFRYKGNVQPMVILRKHFWNDSREFRTPRKEPNDKGIWTNATDYDYYRYDGKEWDGALTTVDALATAISRMNKYLIKGAESSDARIRRAESKTASMQAKVDVENEKIQKFIQVKSNSILSDVNEEFFDRCPNLVEDGWKYTVTNVYDIKHYKIKHIDETLDFAIKLGLSRFENDEPKEYASFLYLNYQFKREPDGIKEVKKSRAMLGDVYNLDSALPVPTIEGMPRHPIEFNARFRSFFELDYRILESMDAIDYGTRVEKAIELRNKIFTVLDKVYVVRKKAEMEIYDIIKNV